MSEDEGAICSLIGHAHRLLLEKKEGRNGGKEGGSRKQASFFPQQATPKNDLCFSWINYWKDELISFKAMWLP